LGKTRQEKRSKAIAITRSEEKRKERREKREERREEKRR